MLSSPSERLYDVLRSVDQSEATEIGDRLLSRSAGRLLEETVELVLACGLPVEKIFLHVMDAIHNESLKAGRFPSEIRDRRADHAEVVGEFADVDLIHDYLRHIARVTPEEMQAAALAKVDKMEAARDAGTLTVIDGLMYTKRAPAR